MKRLILALCALTMLAACGDDAQPEEISNNDGTYESDPIKLAENCIARGGHAVFTTYSEGQMRHYYGCERIPADPVTP